MKNAATDRILEFEGLRGFLSWWVVLDHILMACGFTTKTLPRGLRIFCHGDYAVDVFIMLSGFVIFKLIHDARESYFIFLARRFFRLYPVYIVCLALSLVLFPLLGSNVRHWQDVEFMQFCVRIWDGERARLAEHLLVHLTLLHGAVPGFVLPGSSTAILGAAWSISLEWQFYLVAPLLFLFLQKKGFGGMAVLSLCVIIASWLLQGRLALIFSVNAFLPQKIIMFLIGMLSFLLWQQRPGNGDAPALFLAGFAPLILFFTLSIPLTLWSVMLALAMAGEGSICRPVVALLKQPFIQKLGRISYSTYLAHMCCVVPVEWLLFRIFPGASRGGMICMLLPTAAVTTYLASCALHQWVEVPGMRLGRRITTRHPAA